MKTQNNVVLAIAAGSESVERVFKKYTGVGTFSFVCVNPTKAEMKALLDREVDEEPVYITKEEIKDADGNVTGEVDQIRLCFYMKTDPEKCGGVDTVIPVSYNIQKRGRTSQSGKIQVINIYGETTWIDPSVLQTKQMPENMSFYDTTGMRPAAVGEEELTKFIKAYLNIKNKSYRKADGEIVTLPNLQDAYCQLDGIGKYFTGDISEIKLVMKSQPTNRMKFACYVRSAEGKEYQRILAAFPMKLVVNNYEGLAKFIAEKQELGALSDTNFGVFEQFGEYQVAPTSFTETAQNDPFASNTTGDMAW